MTKSNLALGLALSGLLSDMSLAGGNTPVRSGQQALRSVVVGWAVSYEGPGHIRTFSEAPRELVDTAMRQIAAVTTPAALAGNPAGVVIPCSEGGSLRARMAPGPLRVLRVEWVNCDTNEFGWSLRTQGPVEITFLGTSFTPTAVLSMRFGDRTRDLVREHPATGSNETAGGGRQRWNFRATGNLPLRASDDSGLPFPGRFTAQIDGIYETTSFLPAFPNPGPPYYPQTQLFTARGLLVSTAFEGAGYGASRYVEDFRVLTGAVTHRLQTISTPTRPGRTFDTTFRYADLRVTRGFDSSIGHGFWTLDGKVESNLGPYYGFPGCTAPETFSYQTREMLLNENVSYTALLAGGELAVNDNVTARFHITGSEYGVDLLGHVHLDVARVGSFAHTAEYSFDDLITEAGCAP